MHEKGVISVDEKIQKMTINWGASKNFAKNFTVSLDEKNGKQFKIAARQKLYVNNFFLIDFVLFSIDR